MQDRPFPFDPRLLYVGMNHEDVYYEVRFLRLTLRGYACEVLKPDDLVGAILSGPSIPCFAMPTFRGYVYKRRQPTFWLLGTLREQIIHKEFRFDTDLSRLKPWFV